VKIGRFRVDVMTTDSIAWEIDGKDYHNEANDKRRDLEILRGMEVKAIVRIPAAIGFYFQDAATHVADSFLAGAFGNLRSPNHRNIVTRPNDLAKQADKLEEMFYFNGWDDIRFDCFCSQHCVAMNQYFDVADIGHPFAFLPKTHRIWERLDAGNHALASWSTSMVKRDLANQCRWEDQ